MITSLNFIHLRSTRGLIRHAKRLAKMLKHVIEHIATEKDALKEDINKGNEKAVDKIIEKIMELYLKEEHELDEETLIQEKVIYGTMQDEKKDEKYLEKLFKKLKNHPDLLKKLMDIKKDLNEIDSHLEAQLHEARKGAKDIYLDRSQIVKYVDVAGDIQIAHFLKTLARLERKDAKHEHKDQNKFEKSLNDLIKLSKQDPLEIKKVEEVINELKTEIESLKHYFLKEGEHIAKFLHYTNVLHIRLLKHVKKGLPEKFGEIAKEGFSEKLLKEDIEPKYHNLVENIERATHHLLKMARYEERHATGKAGI